MHTMRAMRRLKPDPVPDELIRKILLAGQAAANHNATSITATIRRRCCVCDQGC
jgi:nitroreductase